MDITPNKTHIVSNMELCLWNDKKKEDQIIPEGTPGLIIGVGSWEDILLVDFDGFFSNGSLVCTSCQH